MTAIDWAAEAIELLRRERGPQRARARRRGAPTGARSTARCDLALAADVLYEERNVEPLLELLPRLAPEVLLAEPGRPHAAGVSRCARERAGASRSSPERVYRLTRVAPRISASPPGCREHGEVTRVELDRLHAEHLARRVSLPGRAHDDVAAGERRTRTVRTAACRRGVTRAWRRRRGERPLGGVGGRGPGRAARDAVALSGQYERSSSSRSAPTERRLERDGEQIRRSARAQRRTRRGGPRRAAASARRASGRPRSASGCGPITAAYSATPASTSSHGRSGASTSWPRSSSSWTSGVQHQPPSQAPCTRTKRATPRVSPTRYDRTHARRRPHRDRDALRRAAARSTSTRSSGSRSTSSTTAPTGSSSPARPARRRRSPTPSGSTSSAPRSRRSATARPSSRAPARTTTAHSVAPDRAGATRPAPTRSSSSRRTTTSRRSAASSRTSRPSPRATDRPIVVYNIPSRVVDQHRARDDHAARRDRERHGREAGERRPGTGAAHRRGWGSTSTRATTTSCSRSSSSAASAGSASTRTSSGRRSPSRCAPCATATSSAPARSTASSGRPTTCCASSPNPIAIKAALNLLGHDVGDVPAAARPADRRTSSRRSAAASSASGCWSPPEPLAEATPRMRTWRQALPPHHVQPPRSPF